MRGEEILFPNLIRAAMRKCFPDNNVNDIKRNPPGKMINIAKSNSQID